ncbi:MAG: hypothetical protein WCZ87_08085 [Thiohalobacteraceae bacterium]
MSLAARILAMMVVVPATFFFIYWVPFSLLPFGNTPIPALVSLACAVAVGRFVWRRLDGDSNGLVASTLRGAVLLGSIGFCAGFFGPMIFVPGANQGPLLGIFVTGPLGFLLGGAGGFVYGLKGRNAVGEG